MFEITNDVIQSFWKRFINYLPDFFGGFLILIIGLILSGVLKKLLLTLLTFFRLEGILQKTKLLERAEVRLWEEILGEVLRWTVILLFLVPTLEVWGLSRATGVINQFLFYLPNVIVAVVIGFIGLVSANLVSDLVKHSTKSIGSTSASTLSVLSKSTILFFTVLIALSQLGVAQDIIRILFTGIVAMLALAGGLAFGLGGKETAQNILEKLRNKLK